MPSTLELTPAGKAKIERFLARVQAAAQAFVTDTALRLREAVAAQAPSETEEAQMLSQGVDTRNAVASGLTQAQQRRNLSGSRDRAVGLFGTPAGGRFLREEGMVSVRTAISEDKIDYAVDGDLAVAGTGSPERINQRTGFSWQTRSRGIQGPTYPFNYAYLQALEFGGLVWTVIPRPGTKALEPEPNRISFRMTKTLQPRRMYRGTLFASLPLIQTAFAGKMREAARNRQ